MKITKINDVAKFTKIINECKGKVELVTGEGDRLNLKSTLSQFVSLANFFASKETDELELIAYEPEDITKLVDFFMEE